MPPTIIYKFGDLVLVPFPFTDQTSTKQRPAIVVSSAACNDARPDLILMAVTSHIRVPSATGDVTIRAWQEAGLIRPSVIKPLLTTLEKRLVIKRLGRLSEQDRQALKMTLSKILNE